MYFQWCSCGFQSKRRAGYWLIDEKIPIVNGSFHWRQFAISNRLVIAQTERNYVCVLQSKKTQFAFLFAIKCRVIHV